MSAPVGPVEEQYAPVFGEGPKPLNVAEFERYSKQNLPRNAHGYYASGSTDMITLRENRCAFSRLRLMPKVLVDVSAIDTHITILGQRVASPICIAPTAMQRMAHFDGELATSRAAVRSDSLMVLSTMTTTSLEDVAAAAPGGYRWFQLYLHKDRKVTLDLIRRAERAGYTALAVTVDTPVLGRREADVRNRFALPSHLTMANFTSGSLAVGSSSAGEKGSGIASYFAGLIDSSLSERDIAWLRRNTKLKIVIKGVITAQAAEAFVEHVDAIWVSNHGARQLDTTPATIEVLPEIARAVAGRVEVYVDGGITRGTDVLKCLALGARAVFIGRPVLWGLAHSGEEGVMSVLKLLNDELVMAMQLSGTVKISEIGPSLVRTARSFQSKL